MNKVNICKVCGAENLVENDMIGRCYNCDNDLCGTPNKALGTRKEGRGADSIYGAFAMFYALIFMLGLACYLLSIFDAEPQIDMLSLCLTMIAVIHIIVIKRIDKIVGFYKGPNRYNILRRLLLYGIIGLIIYEISTIRASDNKDRILYLLMMMQSLMLFYTYYFGKKCTGFNYFNFFYNDRR